MKTLMQFAAVLAHVFWLACAHAQAGNVPPPRSPPPDDSKVVTDTIRNGVVATPGAIVRGTAILQHGMGQNGAVRMLNDAGKVDGIMSGADKAYRLIDATNERGWDGLATESVQLGIEYGAGKATDALVGVATRAAVTSGSSVVAASGAAGVAFAAGSVVGGYMRDSKEFGQALGLNATIGDKVDDAWFKVSPDWVKEAVSGVKQVDVDSPEFEQQARMNAERNRRRNAFAQVQREMEEQQRQMQAAQAAQAAAAQPTAGPSGTSSADPDTSVMVMGQLNQSLQQLQSQRQQMQQQQSQRQQMQQLQSQQQMQAMQAQQQMALLRQQLQQQLQQGVTSPQISVQPGYSAPAPSQCRLDPRTGCHYGHDEKAHPGGCKCGR